MIRIWLMSLNLKVIRIDKSLPNKKVVKDRRVKEATEVLTAN